MVSEYVTIESREKRIQFIGKGESGEVDIILESGSEGLEEIIVKDESKSTYSLDYLSKITKAIINTLAVRPLPILLARCH